jgi:hypothetical protein
MINFESVQSLDEAFVNATEVNLATLEELLMVKKTSQSKVRRQRSICLSMLKICASALLNDTQVRWRHGPHKEFGRVSALLRSSEPEAIEGALDRFILEVQGAARARPPESHPT